MGAAEIKRTSPKHAYFVLEGEKDVKGFYLLYAVEGEKGIYHRTGWRWGCSFEVAEERAMWMNAMMGCSRKDALRIIMATFERESKGNDRL